MLLKAMLKSLNDELRRCGKFTGRLELCHLPFTVAKFRALVLLEEGTVEDRNSLTLSEETSSK